MDKIKLSPSALQNLEKCSWMFFCQNLLKIPQRPSTAMSLGLIAHLVLQLMLKPRRKKLFKFVVGQNSIIGSSLEFLCRQQLNKHKIFSEENLDKLNTFIMTGLRTDFYCEGSTKILTEQWIKLEDDNYIIRGIIDKLIFYDHKKIHCLDFKTSKIKFNKKDAENNLQGQIYSLAVLEEYGVIPEFEFIFLKFVRQPIQKLKKFTKRELLGLKSTLTNIATYIQGFGIKEAKSNYAAYDPNRQYICKRMCQYKNPFIYYSLVDIDGKMLKSSFNKADLEPDLKKGINLAIIQRRYNGCLAWKKVNESM